MHTYDIAGIDHEVSIASIIFSILESLSLSLHEAQFSILIGNTAARTAWP